MWVSGFGCRVRVMLELKVCTLIEVYIGFWVFG